MRACGAYLWAHRGVVAWVGLVLVVAFVFEFGTPGSARKIEHEAQAREDESRNRDKQLAALTGRLTRLTQQLCDNLSASRLASNEQIRQPLKTVALTLADVLTVASEAPANAGARAARYRAAAVRLRRQARNVQLVGEFDCQFTAKGPP